MSRVLRHLMRHLAPLDFMLERPTRDMVNERGGPMLNSRVGGPRSTITLRHERTYARLTHRQDRSSQTISKNSTTAHDICSQTTPFPYIYDSPSEVSLLGQPNNIPPSRNISCITTLDICYQQHYNPQYSLFAGWISRALVELQQWLLSFLASKPRPRAG